MTDIKPLKDRLAQLKKDMESLEKEIARLEKGGAPAQAQQPAPKVKTIDDEPGVLGVFDGQYMITDTGERFEVPANYAAKSRLVYNDKLKMMDKDDKKFFKQLEKVQRRRIEGIINKKEGKWYLLSDSGSYRISDVAAQYNDIKLNDEAVAFIPEHNLNAPFATLDSVVRENAPSVAAQEPVQPDKVKQDAKDEVKGQKEMRKESPKPAPRPVDKEEKPKKPTKKPQNTEIEIDLTTNADNRTAEIKPEVKDAPAQSKAQPRKPESKAPEEKKPGTENTDTTPNPRTISDDDLR